MNLSHGNTWTPGFSWWWTCRVTIPTCSQVGQHTVMYILSVSTRPPHNTNSCYSNCCPLNDPCRQRSSPPQLSSLFHVSLRSWQLSFSWRLKNLWHCLNLCGPRALSPFITLSAMCWPAHLTVITHSTTCLFLLRLCSLIMLFPITCSLYPLLHTAFVGSAANWWQWIPSLLPNGANWGWIREVMMSRIDENIIIEK